MTIPTTPAVPTSIGLCFRTVMIQYPQGTNLNRRPGFPKDSALDETQHGGVRLAVGHCDRICGDKGGHEQGRADAHDTQKKPLHGSKTWQAELRSAPFTSRRNCRKSFIG